MNKAFLHTFFASLIVFGIVVALTASAVSTPVANAGQNQYVNSNQSVILQGSGYDPDGGSIIYYWSCTGGSLSNNNIAQPVYTAPYIAQYNNQATYTCTLTVTNNYGYSNSSSCTIFVNYNQVGGTNVQTNSATNVSNYQATLNGYLSSIATYVGNTAYVWFEWGTSTSYGNQTDQQTLNSAGSFNKNIVNLSSNTTYHYRAVAQNNTGLRVYGQDMTFYTSGSGSTGSLYFNKKVINLTSGNLNWSDSVNANPYDILSFAITIQAPSNQELQNVYVRDVLPANLIYKGNLTVNANLNYSGGTPSSGINIGTIPADGITIVYYQVQVAGAESFNYGNTTLTNTATVTSNQTGSQTDSATVFVNRYGVQGATTINTGLTNDILNDSFLIPLMIILLTVWLYFSGRAYRFADWVATKIKR